MKSTITTLISIFIFQVTVHAQSGFEKVYGGDLPDWFRTVTATSDGGIIAGGTTRSFGFGNSYNSDGYIVKMNSNGDTLWSRHFGEPTYDEEVYSIVENAAGYLAAGYNVTDTPALAYYYYAVQFDESGNKLWERFYGNPGYEYCNDVIADNHNRNILCGGAYYSGLSYDFYAVKTDAAGNKISDAHFGNTGADWASAIIQTSDGGYAMAGYTNSGTPGYDIYVLKTDSNFIFQWAQNYGGALDDFGYDIAEDANGNLWILGSEELYPDTVGMVLIKTDANGQNPVTFFPSFHNGDFGYSIRALNSGGFLIGGVTNDLGKGSEMLLEKLNSSGDTLWTKHFGGTQSESGLGVTTDANSNILLAGETEGFGVNQFDAYLVKLDSAGNIPCPSAVSFVSSSSPICEDENIFFTNTSISSHQFSWSENGNNFSSDVDAAYYFTSGGNYNVTLSACNASSTQNITVYSKPRTHFTYANSGTNVNFTLDTSINVQTISWNFGDGSPLNTMDINPSHNYPTVGAYWVIVSVTNTNGCDSTYIAQINLSTGIDEPKANSLILFPSPAHESVMLQTSGNIFPLSIVIMSMQGSAIKELVVRKSQEEISVSDLVPGIYFLKLRDSSGSLSALKLEVY